MFNSTLYRGRDSNGRFISEKVKAAPLMSLEESLKKAIVPKAQDGKKLIAKDSVPNEYLLRQLYRESLFNEKAKSGKDAKGLAQLRDITVKELEDKFGVKVDPMNPKEAIIGHKTLMFDLYNKPWVTKGNPTEGVRLLKATAGYNYGPTATVGALNKAKAAGVDIYKDVDSIKKYLPDETKNYYTDISGNNPEFEKNYQKAVSKFKYASQYPTQKKQSGGVITDPRGQWAHPGKVTKIESNDITMKGVPYPVLGKSDNGLTAVMQPGQDYKFPGAKSVTEFPMQKPKMASGGSFRFGTVFSTNRMPNTFSMHTGGTNWSTYKPKKFSFNSPANLGNKQTQILLNKLRTFEHGGNMTLGSKPNRRDLLKKGVDATLYPLPFKKGGKIEIKPENRGKFTASAEAAGHGVQEHARMVLNDPNASPLQKKRANFARNAAGWNKENGGTIMNKHLGDNFPPKSYQLGGQLPKRNDGATSLPLSKPQDPKVRPVPLPLPSMRIVPGSSKKFTPAQRDSTINSWKKHDSMHLFKSGGKIK